VSKNEGKNESKDLPRTYEEARSELEDVVRRLETGGVALEESLALWERGEQLAQQCQEWLDGARRRLDAVREPSAAAEPATIDPAEPAED
jgi:exodeoxyribonuclease VII small subunit